MAHGLKSAGIFLATAALALAALAEAASPFAYRMAMTPEESPVASVVEGRYTPAFAACQNTAVATTENAACFIDEFPRQDMALNEAWQTVFPRMPAQQRSLLRAAQRRWVAARDPFCRKESDGFSGGTIAPVIYVSCRTEQTIRRTLWLEKLAGAR